MIVNKIINAVIRKWVSVALGLLVLAVIIAIAIRSAPDGKEVLGVISSRMDTIKVPKVEVIYREVHKPSDIVPVNCDAVVPVTYTRVISLSGLQPKERKKKFIDLILPSILVVNYEVAMHRRNLIKIKEKIDRGLKLSRLEIKYLQSLMDRCKADSISDVMKKANPVPPSLIIAQAIVESGWGTSRFFVEGNNLFGIWTFAKDRNALRATGSGARLRKFDSILEAVRYYIYNVNVGWAYEDFREHRLKRYDSLELSEFLSFYSIERDRYVEKLKKIIEINDLRRFDLCSLDPAYIK